MPQCPITERDGENEGLKCRRCCRRYREMRARCAPPHHSFHAAIFMHGSQQEACSTARYQVITASRHRHAMPCWSLSPTSLEVSCTAFSHALPARQRSMHWLHAAAMLLLPGMPEEQMVNTSQPPLFENVIVAKHGMVLGMVVFKSKACHTWQHAGYHLPSFPTPRRPAMPLPLSEQRKCGFCRAAMLWLTAFSARRGNGLRLRRS